MTTLDAAIAVLKQKKTYLEFTKESVTSTRDSFNCSDQNQIKNLQSQIDSINLAVSILENK